MIDFTIIKNEDLLSLCAAIEAAKIHALEAAKDRDKYNIGHIRGFYRGLCAAKAILNGEEYEV